MKPKDDDSARMMTRPLRRRPPLKMYGIPPDLQHKADGQYVRDSFIRCWRNTSRPPRPSPEDFHALCPRFSLSEAEGAAVDFELLEIVQMTFYDMLLIEAVELGVAHNFTAESMKSSLVGLRWSTFEVWMGCLDQVLRAAQLQRPIDEVEVCGSQDG
ncbi:hypothetical protein Cgig2_019037 [Carnegiea gigantea]|uniref:Uncharacterized protein n=1 Tax=Carnegiea gigantea TaxID=171969 RepID=A0A9Q1GYJ0_9CARY|nr:hypothetical protein Cgig2_019037 [Carnegiea gigantea]